MISSVRSCALRKGMSDLPPGQFNLPPGVRLVDLSPPDRYCSCCGRAYKDSEGDDELCDRCVEEYDE
jgi:hypothetical protein